MSDIVEKDLLESARRLLDKGKGEDGAGLREARRFLHRLLEQNPRHADALVCLADTYAREGFLDEAAELLELATAHAEDPIGVQLMLAGFFVEHGLSQRAQEVIKEIGEVPPEHAAEVAFLKGRIAFQLGELKEAAEWLERAVGEEATAEVYCSMGGVYDELGDVMKAKICYETVLGMEPDHLHAYEGLAKICLDEGEPSQALGYLEKGLEVAPGDQGLLLRLGQVHEALSNWDQAAQAYLQVLRASPRDVEAMIGMGRVCVRRKEYDSAERWLTRAQRYDADHPDIYFALGLLFFERGRLEKAAKAFGQCLKLDYEWPEPRFYLGLIREKQGRKLEAILSLRKFLSMSPDGEFATEGKEHLYRLTAERRDG